MARKFLYGETVSGIANITARLGAQSAGYTDKELFKFVKPSGESAYVLCAAGDQIGGRIAYVDPATSDGYTIASIQREGRMLVTFDGLQATPGTGTIALGDQVVCGTVVAAGTGLGATPAKVCKATTQVGTIAASTVASADTAAAVKVVIDAELVIIAAQLALVASGNIWVVRSLGSAGTGAVGTTGIIERVFDIDA